MSEKSYANRLYPDGYSFDWEVFLSDPEGYKFTAEDIAFLNAKDLEKVESETPMNSAEKRILRKWVRDGNLFEGIYGMGGLNMNGYID